MRKNIEQAKEIRKRGIGKKISALIISSVILVVFITVGFSIISFIQLMKDKAKVQAIKGVEGLFQQIDMQKANAKDIAALLATDQKIIDGVQKKDKDAIKQVMAGISENINADFITFSDENGTAIFRTHDPENFGDSVMGEENVVRALSGEATTLVEKGTAIPLSVIASCPIKDDSDHILGVVSTGTRLDNNDLLDKSKSVLQTDLTVFLDNIRIATTIEKDGKRVIGTELDPKIADVVLNQKNNYSGEADIIGQKYITYYSPILDSEGKAIGLLFAGQPMTQFYADLSQILVIVMTIAVLTILFVVIISVLIIKKSLTKPLRETSQLANELASGNLDHTILVKNRDEIGDLSNILDKDVRQAFKNIESAKAIADKQAKYQAQEVEKVVVNLERLSRGELYCDITVNEPDEDTKELFRVYDAIASNLRNAIGSMSGYISEITQVLGEMADGNLDVGIRTEYKGDFVKLKESINGIAVSLNDVLGEINIAAQQVASGTSQVSDGSQAISQGATEQASAIEQLTSTVTEIAAQTKQNAMSASRANEMSEEAKNNAVKGNEQMTALQQAMAQINDSSASISKIIKVIDDIAFQTNILALNAAVEAARAGVHGKGFAVVAEEVRNLAARSAAAAKETTELIEGSIKKTEVGTKIADETAKALEQIVKGVEKAVDLVAEIASASNQQATAIGEVNRGIEQMSQVVQTNSATSEETAAAAEELSSQAAMLKEMVGKFELTDAAAMPLKQTAPRTEPYQEKQGISLDDGDFGKY